MELELMLQKDWTIYKPCEAPKSCVLVLPGRSGTGRNIASHYLEAELSETLIVGITPNHLEWYPMPNGPYDQDASVACLPKAIKAVLKVINKISETYDIPKDK